MLIQLFIRPPCVYKVYEFINPYSVLRTPVVILLFLKSAVKVKQFFTDIIFEQLSNNFTEYSKQIIKPSNIILSKYHII